MQPLARTTRSLSIAVALAATLGACAGYNNMMSGAPAMQVGHRLELTGAQEVPPVTTSATGKAVVMVTKDSVSGSIETTGIKENVQFRWTPHSEGMKITERLHLLSPDILRNDIVVEDEYLARPWTYSYTYRRMPGYKLLEYICEDNREYVDEQGMARLRIEEQP